MADLVCVYWLFLYYEGEKMKKEGFQNGRQCLLVL